MKRNYYYFIFVFILFVGCNDFEVEDIGGKTDLTNVSIPGYFNYQTTKEVQVSITAPEFLQNAVFSLASFKTGSDSTIFAKGGFDENNKYEAIHSIGSYIDTIKLVSQYAGLITDLSIPIIGNEAIIDLNQYYDGTFVADPAEVEVAPVQEKIAARSFDYMGRYNYLGVPYYLDTNDQIEQSLLDDINRSLPEGRKVQDSHPEFLGNAVRQINLTETADVWVTFVTEGANYRNALGYYTYPTNNPPSSLNDVSDLTIIYPNTSLVGSGGGLTPGNKVYLGRFDANTSIGWFISANGWNGYSVNFQSAKYFSNSNFNPEYSAQYRDHMVSLYDANRKLIVLGFEDLNRAYNGSDDDFNDAVYYATVTPFSAVDPEGVEPIDSANDKDGDGVNDENDDYPNDPDKAYNNFYPSEDEIGSLAFEDLWPGKGDYDFNDLVVDYNFNLIANSHNLITKIEADFMVKHIGASFNNGFALKLPISANKIESVTNQKLNVGYANVASNGVEQGVTGTVIFVAEGIRSFLDDTIHLEIEFTQGVSTADLGGVPFDPFLVVDETRDREVHLPGMEPTSLIGDYFGTYDDNSIPASGRYYKTKRNLPWAINIYRGYTVPVEKVSIDKQYPGFVNWATSGGVLDQDWYLHYSY